MFDTICNLIPQDRDYPARARRLAILQRVLNGTVYDVLPYEFHDERSAGGEYVPLRARKPSVRYGLCRVVVEDSVALLFSEGHFPTLDCADPALAAVLADLVRESRLNQVMIDAAIRGAIGSVAVLMRVLRGRVFFSVLDTVHLTPHFDPQAPDTLARVSERYKVAGAELGGPGLRYRRSRRQLYWFQRVLGRARRRPGSCRCRVGMRSPPTRWWTRQRSTRHRLGFVPLVWLRNLPGGDEYRRRLHLSRRDRHLHRDRLSVEPGGARAEIFFGPDLAGERASDVGCGDCQRRGQCAGGFRKGRCASCWRLAAQRPPR